MKRGDTYRCKACGGVFETPVSEDEMVSEFNEIFGGTGLPAEEENVAVVCDDCFKRLMVQFS